MMWILSTVMEPGSLVFPPGRSLRPTVFFCASSLNVVSIHPIMSSFENVSSSQHSSLNFSSCFPLHKSFIDTVKGFHLGFRSLSIVSVLCTSVICPSLRSLMSFTYGSDFPMKPSLFASFTPRISTYITSLSLPPCSSDMIVMLPVSFPLECLSLSVSLPLTEPMILDSVHSMLPISSPSSAFAGSSMSSTLNTSRCFFSKRYWMSILVWKTGSLQSLIHSVRPTSCLAPSAARSYTMQMGSLLLV
mmetsp:Transcript_18795/g.61722  ORF Transcript_18795/g.61722 Transcript_18795/m.61722 type:complete len:246 (-) Transcript_18795:79-816(-)